MSLYPAISQRTYPGVGDIDDCTVIATFWAARAAGFSGPLPTVAEFRAAAGRPDTAGATGLTVDNIAKGVAGTALDALDWQRITGSWDPFAALIRAGHMASLMVLSSKLPAPLGFAGLHQVGLGWDGGFRIANPLAPDHSAPAPITEAAIKGAVLATGGVAAVVFAQESDMQAAITDETPCLMDVPLGASLLELDGKTVLRKMTTALPGRPSPYGVGTLRAMFATTGGVRRTVLVKPTAIHPIPAPDCVPLVAAATEPLKVQLNVAQTSLSVANAKLSAIKTAGGF